MSILKRENYRFYKEYEEDIREYFEEICRFCDAFLDGICSAKTEDILKCQEKDREILKEV